jgi:hypothetical protein
MAKVFKLEITFDADTKRCNVTGPINDPELCYIGLELARRGIRDYNSGKVQVVRELPPVVEGKPSPVVPKLDLPPLRLLGNSG